MSGQNTLVNATVATVAGAAVAVLLVTMAPSQSSQLWTGSSVSSSVQSAPLSSVRSLRQPTMVGAVRWAQQAEPSTNQAIASGESLTSGFTSKVVAPVFFLASGILMMVAAFRQLKPVDEEFSIAAVSALDRQREERRRRLAEEERQVNERRARLAREEMELRRKMGIVVPPTPGRPAAAAAPAKVAVSLEPGSTSDWARYRQAREQAERQKAEQARRELEERKQRLQRLESGR